MSETSRVFSRRSVLATSAAAGLTGLLSIRPVPAAEESPESAVIRPFSVHIPEADLVDVHFGIYRRGRRDGPYPPSLVHTV